MSVEICLGLSSSGEATGSTPYLNNGLGAAPVLVKAGSVALASYVFRNPTVISEYINFYDAASIADVTVGTTTPTYVIGAKSLDFANEGYSRPLQFTKGLVIAESANPYTYVFSGVTMGVSLVDGSAFLTNVSGSIPWYLFLNRPITVSDGTQTATGFIKAAGTGETYTDIIGGTNPALLNGNFVVDEPAGTTWTRGTGWTIAGGVGIATNVINGSFTALYQLVSPAAGTLTRLQWDLKTITEGSISSVFIALLGGIKTIAEDNITEYFVSTGTLSAVGLRQRGAPGAELSGTVDNFKAQSVLTPSTTGATIVSTKGGATQSWATNSGLNGNVASFTVTIGV